MIQSSTSGMQYFFRGMSMLTHPKLRNYVIIPLLINIVLFAALSWVGYHYFSQFVHWMDSFIPHWLQWLSWILWILFAIADLVIMAYTFTLIANIIAAPFNSSLSERVQELITGEKKSASALSQVKDIPRSVGRAGLWLLYYIPRAIFFAILFLIPGVNAAAPFTWFAFNAWVMSVQYMDYPMDNNGHSFKHMRELLSQQRGTNLGFGSGVLLITMIPIINFVAMPAAVIGATLLWCERYK
tara:strand:- start:88563 stop:89285 length:723 start_codon:yes stop_codon:yes gene_type:complete